MTGHYRCYRPKKFQKASLDLIGYANEIIEAEKESRGLDMTLRQIHYKLVNRPDYANNLASYNRLKKLLSEGRLAGLVSWTAIQDRERAMIGHHYHDHPNDVFKNLDRRYRRNKWRDQPFYAEVWVEKKSQIEVIGQICDRLEINYFASKGYNSQTEQWWAGQRLAQAFRRGQTPIIFNLCDHDPSGIDMVRDNRERLSMFAGAPVIVQRLALNMDQVERYKPHPNPAKELDSRTDEYYRQFGTYDTWEMDALDSVVIQDLIEAAIMKIRDEKLWAEATALEVEDKLYIREQAEQLGAVSEDDDDLSGWSDKPYDPMEGDEDETDPDFD